eukprot:TRINITY_DN830_c0_g1_i11.p1 TRINITY_DN830_c0_g1~~TRINITY_DN830_c0_g1_i11.p1  ORF type:complete len:282 (-),score=84.78 TRINITY_DN830_c0_g1_i11:173-1018(-)
MITKKQSAVELHMKSKRYRFKIEQFEQSMAQKNDGDDTSDEVTSKQDISGRSLRTKDEKGKPKRNEKRGKSTWKQMFGSSEDEGEGDEEGEEDEDGDNDKDGDDEDGDDEDGDDEDGDEVDDLVDELDSEEEYTKFFKKQTKNRRKRFEESVSDDSDDRKHERGLVLLGNVPMDDDGDGEFEVVSLDHVDPPTGDGDANSEKPDLGILENSREFQTKHQPTTVKVSCTPSSRKEDQTIDRRLVGAQPSTKKEEKTTGTKRKNLGELRKQRKKNKKTKRSHG